MTANQGYNGNPFRGLSSFEQKHAEVFYGRSDQVAEALGKLERKSNLKQPFLLLLGDSGAGKSSLLEAGIIPALNHSPTDFGASQFLYAKVKSADLCKDPLKGLVDALTTVFAGELIAPDKVRQMTQLCKENPTEFFTRLAEVLNRIPSGSRLIIGVHQLERLFIDQELNPLHCRFFSDILARLVTDHQVWLVVTLRSDYYHRLSDFPALMALKNNDGQLDLTPPGVDDIAEIVREPAAMAGLSFEQDPASKLSLDDILIERTEKTPNSLPLLQFTLEQLYLMRSHDGMLTLNAFRKLGGVERSIPVTAERIYESLNRSLRKHFTRTFTRLTLSSNKGHFERLWVKSDDLIVSDRAHQFVQAYIDGGLLCSDVNAEGEAVICIIHDCLFEHWPRLIECLESNYKLQMLKDNMESQAQQWQTATRPSAYLLSKGKALEEGKLLLKHGGSLSPAVKSLINGSIKRAQQKNLVLYAGGMMVLLAFAFVLTKAYNSKINSKLASQNLDKSHELIEFMVDDSHRHFEALGHVDKMQQSAQRAYEYFTSIELNDSSSTSKDSRAKTLFKIAKINLATGNYKTALDAFLYTLALEKEIGQVNPNGFVYLLELAQTQYWIAKTYEISDDLDNAEQYYQAYQKTTYDLISLQPDSLEAKLELAQSYAKMADLAVRKGQDERALQMYLEAIKFAEKGRSEANQERLIMLANAYQWVAGKYFDELKLDDALEMIRGEMRTRVEVLEGNDTHENALNLQMANWRATNITALIGQMVQSINTAEKIQAESQVWSERFPEQIVWQYLEAFSTSRLAQLNLLTGRIEDAKSLFIKSFMLLDHKSQITDPQWREASFERQYWYVRLLNRIESADQDNLVEQTLVNHEHPDAHKWQARLAVLKGNSFALPSEVALRKIKDPDALIAYLELALSLNEVERTELLRAMVPKEMWLNPDLDRLRPAIRELLKDIAN